MKIYELQELYGIKDENNPAKLEAFIQNKAVLDYIDTSESEDTLIALNKQRSDQGLAMASDSC